MNATEVRMPSLWKHFNVTVERNKFYARKDNAMRFHFEIDLNALPQPHDAELGRILWYWAGNLSHYDLSAETSESIRDSAYEKVGSWRVTA